MTPIGFVLTFFHDFIGSVGSRVYRPNGTTLPLNVQAVRSIDSTFVDPDNGITNLVVTDFGGHRHHVPVDWLTAIRPAQADLVGNIV